MIRISPGSVCLLVLLGVLGGRARADERSPEEIQRIRAQAKVLAAVPDAVDRGLAWLVEQQREDGSFAAASRRKGGGRINARYAYGTTALGLLALAHCGRGLDDPAVERALRYVRRNYATVVRGNGISDCATYSLSIVLMALYELHRGAAVLGLDEDEGRTPSNPLGLAPWARALVSSSVRYLVRTRAASGLFGYPSVLPALPPGEPRHPQMRMLRADLSNTQYALLGLWAGSRCGEHPPRETLSSLVTALLDAQEAMGAETPRRVDRPTGRYAPPTDRARGFGYRPSSGNTQQVSTGSMTAGGLSSLLVVKAMLLEAGALEAERREKLDQGIWDAIAWLTAHYEIRLNPMYVNLAAFPPELRKQVEAGHPQGVGAGWHGYYLYGLERALVIAGKRLLGRHDWYVEGARLLLDAQAEDGSWKDGTAGAGNKVRPRGGQVDPCVDACFALLFLKRASLRPRSDLLEAAPVAPSGR